MKVDGVQHTPSNINKTAAKAAALILLSAAPSYELKADDVIDLKPSLEQDTFEFVNPEENEEEEQQSQKHGSATQSLIVGITGLLMTCALIKSVIDNNLKSEYIDDLNKKLDEKEEENKNLKEENSKLKETNKNLTQENYRLSEDYSNVMAVYGETRPERKI